MELAQLLHLAEPAATPRPGKESYRVQRYDLGSRSMQIERFADEHTARRRFRELMAGGGGAASRLTLTERTPEGWQTRSSVTNTRTTTAAVTPGERDAFFRRLVLSGPSK